MGQDLKRDELVGMVESLLEMASVEEMIDAVAQAVLNKEAYARTNWPDQPNTFEYYERMHPILMTMLASSGDLGKEIKAKAEEDRLARLEEAVASRAAQDAEFEARNAAAKAAAQQAEQETLDAIKQVSNKYLFHVKIIPAVNPPNDQDTLIAAFVEKSYWAQNHCLESDSIDELCELLPGVGMDELEEGIFEVTTDGPPDQTHVTKVVDFLNKMGFGNDPAFEAFINAR
jgi:regulator of replication initiation timing